jgi:NAD(P)-dependent dehydrogenase (short-subunit alcohol dehydrogenase family)
MGKLENRIALVTGSGRGIGRGVALAMAEEGASLGLIDLEGHAAAIAQIPLRRVGDCQDDVGRVCVFLASDDASYVTGQTMWVDGGSGSVR